VARPHRAAPRARFASDPAASRGRLEPEPQSPTRTAFQRDRDRILHSTAFRRLTHKTQVFVSHEGDHFRTRLTHTLEVAQIARSIARTLGLDEDLTEAVALAHDLGHTPFGHEGEDVLDRCLAGHGGFDHNAQSLRIVTRLERRYAAFDGLNLSWETLEGIAKHNGPLVGPDGRPCGRYARRPLPPILAHPPAAVPVPPAGFASAEAQVAAIADDIAYDAHDIDDGTRAGLVPVAALADVPLVGDLHAGVRRHHPGLDDGRLVAEVVRQLVGALVDDVLAESRRRIAEDAPGSADEVRAGARPLIAFGTAGTAHDAAIKSFLFKSLYRHPKVMAIRAEAGRVVTDLFTAFTADPTAMPPAWCADLAGAEDATIARRAADYIAGMTDRFALCEHRRLFDDTPDLR
jgi:dGTPase